MTDSIKYRSSDQARLVIAMSAAMAIISFIPMVGGALPWPVCLASAAAWVYLGVHRVGLSHVAVVPDGIVIQNPFSRRAFVAWKEISHFDIGRWAISPHVGRVHLLDGRTLHLAAVQSTSAPRGPEHPNPSERIIADLNLIASRKKAEGTGSL